MSSLELRGKFHVKQISYQHSAPAWDGLQIQIKPVIIELFLKTQEGTKSGQFQRYILQIETLPDKPPTVGQGNP